MPRKKSKPIEYDYAEIEKYFASCPPNFTSVFDKWISYKEEKKQEYASTQSLLIALKKNRRVL